MKSPSRWHSPRSLVSARSPPPRPPRTAKAHATRPPRDGRRDARLTPGSPAKDFFKAERSALGRYALPSGDQPIAYDAVAGTLVVHAKDWQDTDAVEADTTNPPTRTRTAQARSVDVLHGLLQAGRADGRVGRSPSCSTAARDHRPCGCDMGAFGPVRVVTVRSTPHRRRLTRVVNNDQSLLDAIRPRLHRRAGHRLQPHRRQGQGKGLLRRRPGHPRLHRFHHPVPDQVRPLELAQISVRRKLRDDARRRAWRSRCTRRTSISTASSCCRTSSTGTSCPTTRS